MRNSITYSFYLLLSATFLFVPSTGNSQETDSITLPGIFDLLYAYEIAEINIQADLSYLVENKKTFDEYIDGKFTFEPSEGVSQTLPVKIKCRGKYRRMKCEFPPFKLKFRKDDLTAHDLNEFNELKLVTHCIGVKEKGKDLILREFLAYKLYNILTPYSFRVQLVKVNYLNTKGRPKKIKGWGILIEDSDELAYRMGGEKFMEMGLPPEIYNPEQEKITALFNYMIGNTDWSCHMARNLEFIKYSDTNIMVVPYDFDFAGLVNAPYAIPNYELGQKTLQDRVYMGQKCKASDLEATFQHFIKKKEEMTSLIENANMLHSQSKVEMKNYLTSFFDIIEMEENAQDTIFMGR